MVRDCSLQEPIRRHAGVMCSRYRRERARAVPSLADQIAEAFEANPCSVPFIVTALSRCARAGQRMRAVISSFGLV